jgi:GNAT superfamily N-acetyltransferase
MSTFSFVIRDGLEDDIERCLALDHTYTTETVWQMTFQPHQNGWQATFRPERLPREIDVTYEMTAHRLQQALKQSAFLVAIGKDDPTLLGYLVLGNNLLNQVVTIRDLVVSRPFRRAGVGKKLFNVAKRWAIEHDAHVLLAETQTKNFPAIQFCQRHGLAFCGFNDQYFTHHEIALFFGQTL